MECGTAYGYSSVMAELGGTSARNGTAGVGGVFGVAAIGVSLLLVISMLEDMAEFAPWLLRWRCNVSSLPVVELTMEDEWRWGLGNTRRSIRTCGGTNRSMLLFFSTDRLGAYLLSWLSSISWYTGSKSSSSSSSSPSTPSLSM